MDASVTPARIATAARTSAGSHSVTIQSSPSVSGRPPNTQRSALGVNVGSWRSSTRWFRQQSIPYHALSRWPLDAASRSSGLAASTTSASELAAAATSGSASASSAPIAYSTPLHATRVYQLAGRPKYR